MIRFTDIAQLISEGDPGDFADFENVHLRQRLTLHSSEADDNGGRVAVLDVLSTAYQPRPRWRVTAQRFRARAHATIGGGTWQWAEDMDRITRTTVLTAKEHSPRRIGAIHAAALAA
ncbi:hypothetical protein [Kocuria palustris]|uniref:hypothetical protein n=1 Tax=Kocuria palustris TaxID=71999 RepID=UPI003D722312